MDKQYHYLSGQKQEGPVSFDVALALIQIGKINATTLIWHTELTDWTPAANLQEFSTRFAASQPPAPPAVPVPAPAPAPVPVYYAAPPAPATNGGGVWPMVKWLAIGIVCVALVYGYNMIQVQNAQHEKPSSTKPFAKTVEKTRQELEMDNPADYIHLRYQQRQNLLNVMVFDVYLSSSAKKVVYRNVKVEAICFDGDDAVVGRIRGELGRLAPGQVQQIEMRGKRPKFTDRYEVVVMDMDVEDADEIGGLFGTGN